jgi:hypothetical protein
MLLLAIGLVSASAQGLKLFCPDMKAAAPKPQAVVIDFMERYFQDLSALKHTTVKTKMADDKVFFRKGSLSDLNQVADTMPLNISLVDRHYEVTWQKDNQPFIIVVFPAQYDLLLGVSQKEAQMRVKETVLSVPESVGTLKVTAENNTLEDSLRIDKDSVFVDKDSIFYTKTAYLEQESFNDAVYYNKVRENYRCVFDTLHLEYSAANLFHGLIPDKDYRMYVEQSVYGLKTINYTLSLRKWLNYCAKWGLKVFFAVEEHREDGLLALLIAQSKELGFNHMLSVVIPHKFVTDTNAVMKVRMTPYIPIHNIKNLFQEEYVKHRKIEWQ